MEAMTEENIIELLDHLVKSANTRPTHREAMEMILAYATAQADAERQSWWRNYLSVGGDDKVLRYREKSDWLAAVLARIGWPKEA